jgi:hypothetical protein
MTLDEITGRLDHVRSFQKGRAMARCPAHDDGRASLSLRELDDGTVLLHCFAGCQPIDVVQALGLEFRNLFPDDRHSSIRRVEPSEQPRLSAADALAALDHEVHVAAIIAADILEFGEVSRDTWERLAKAARLIGDARAVCCPARIEDLKPGMEGVRA